MKQNSCQLEDVFMWQPVTYLDSYVKGRYAIVKPNTTQEHHPPLSITGKNLSTVHLIRKFI